jgi:hypothetical protein
MYFLATFFFLIFLLFLGVSYAALMKKRPKQKPPEKSSDLSSDSLSDGETGSLSTSDESDTYEPGFLDDPAMVSAVLVIIVPPLLTSRQP